MARDPVEPISYMIADYCVQNGVDIKDFDFSLFFLTLEDLS